MIKKAAGFWAFILAVFCLSTFSAVSAELSQEQITQLKTSIEKLTPEQKDELLLMIFQETYSVNLKVPNLKSNQKQLQIDKLGLSYYDQGLTDGRMWSDGKIDNIVINTKYGVFHYSPLTSKQQLQDYYKGVKDSTKGKFKFFVIGVIDERYDK